MNAQPDGPGRDVRSIAVGAFGPGSSMHGDVTIRSRLNVGRLTVGSNEALLAMPQLGTVTWDPWPLLATKLTIPSLARSIDRPRLFDILGRDPACTATVVTGAAGTGKTTLLASWVRTQEKRQVAWVSLDPGDNDPVRFWDYVCAAIQRSTGIVLPTGSDLARLADPAVIGDTVAQVLERLDDRLTLVLDDLHVIRTRSTLQALGHLVEALAPSSHVVMSGRVEPALAALPRLAMSGRLIHIDGEDLAFSYEEVHDLVRNLHGFDLPPRAVQELHERTEGWPAALHLAVLALTRGVDVATFLRNFVAERPSIDDYIACEVLDPLPEDRRSFLLQTSILDRLSPALCDAVTQRSDSGELLMGFERADLFVTAISDEHPREWVRYHQLFGEVLRRRLEREQPVEVVAELHRRAGTWFLEHGFEDEAARHAFASGDTALFGTVLQRFGAISRCVEGLVVPGRSHREVFERLSRLTDEPSSAEPHVRRAVAWVLLAMGRLARARQWWPEGPRTDADPFLSVLLRLEGDLTGALEHARAAMQATDPCSDEHLYSAAALAPTLYWIGRPEEARLHLANVIPRLAPPRAVFSLLVALGHRALLAADEADSQTVGDLTDQAVQLAEHYGLRNHFTMSACSLALGRRAMEAGDDDTAWEHLREAEGLARRVGERAVLIATLSDQAELASSTGDRDTAIALLEEGRALALTGPDTGHLLAVLHDHGETRMSREQLAEDLTERETAVLRMLQSRLSKPDIARELGVSPNTVKTHVKAIYRKLSVRSRDDAVRRGISLGVIAGSTRRRARQ